MKVLIISHNAFGNINNMGKTLTSYFKGWDVKDIAQIYVQAEIPNSDACNNFYRITDFDIFKSIFTRSSGTVFKNPNNEIKSSDIIKPSKAMEELYNKGKRRTPMVYLARNLLWCLGSWKTKRLLNWVDDFNPDAIFLASGDYTFIYKIALSLAKYKNIPLAVSCMDDYYIYNRNKNKILGKFAHNLFMKKVKETMDYASCIVSISEKMSKDYEKLFQKPCYTLHTPATLSAPLEYEKTNKISYLGNLGYNRHIQLIKLGKALQQIKCENKPEYIDVYSVETRDEIVKSLTKENGLNFHGVVSAEKVLEIMGRSLAVIHTESFDEKNKQCVSYSVSTKIVDSLMSGTCILAYGPPEIASIHYLKENNAAYCITDDSSLITSLTEFMKNEKLRDVIINNAVSLSKRNHDSKINCEMLRDILTSICVCNACYETRTL